MPHWLIYKFRSSKALSQHWGGRSVCDRIEKYLSSEETSRKGSIGNWCLPGSRCSVSVRYSVSWSLPGLKGLSSLRFSLSQTRHSIILGIYHQHGVLCQLIKDFPSLPEPPRHERRLLLILQPQEPVFYVCMQNWDDLIKKFLSGVTLKNDYF